MTIFFDNKGPNYFDSMTRFRIGFWPPSCKRICQSPAAATARSTIN